MQDRGITLLLGLVYFTSHVRTQTYYVTPSSSRCLDLMTCPANSQCIDTGHDYHCSCNPGFILASGHRVFTDPNEKCEDEDECADSTRCPAYAKCVNSLGSFECVCKSGFVKRTKEREGKDRNGMECQDVDECSQSPNPCGPNTRCTNVIGRYKCRCLPGFASPRGNSWIPGRTGPFQCTDIDECLSEAACPLHYTCQNTPGSYKCTCSAGFTLRNSQCEDVDECSQSPHSCGLNTNCTNTIGGYACNCLPGFSSPHGSSWIPGRTGPFQCTDIDECLSEAACPLHYTCQNTPGSYECTCSAGFTLRNSQCEDVDECSQSPQPCGPNTNCTNTIGGYACMCLPGFSSPHGNSWISGRTRPSQCTDVDECSQSPKPCGANTNCTNTVGGYTCNCLPGFSSPHGNYWNPDITGPSQCTDVDECSQSSNPCGPNTNCTNTFGGHTCNCLPGFSSPHGNSWIPGRTGPFQCTDVDECSQRPDLCGPNTNCTNSFGGYTCSCLPGFFSPQGNSWVPGRTGPFQCTDMDECSQSPHPCGPNTNCTNTFGGHTCSCLPGFSSPHGNSWIPGRTGPFQCTDIDECSQSLHPCGPNTNCTNTFGGHTCSCLPGFTSPQGNSWIPGRTGPFQCTDVDECSQRPDLCGPNTNCTNTFGGHTCSCLHGFSSPHGNSWIPGRTGPFQCTDVDECSQKPDLCGPNTSCTNSFGGYTCSCLPGFSSPQGNSWIPGRTGPFQCTDVDECSQSPHPCGPNTNCTNTFGGHTCSCLPGFSSPHGNSWIPGRTGPFQCTDVDECSQSSHPCGPNTNCTNTFGGYTCSCLPGFSSAHGNSWIPGRTGPFQCTDVDECSQSSRPCGPNTNCTNTFGGYTCSCLSGFSSAHGNSWIPGRTGPFQCTDVDECSQRPDLCGSNTKCTNTIGGYTCSCLPGLSSSHGNSWIPGRTGPFQCTDVDECSQSSHPCGPNTNCTNTFGGHTCSCLSGFSSVHGNSWIPGRTGPFQCTDVDECSQRPDLCGPNTNCTNTIGGYTCNCLPGFSSAHGNSWIPGRTGPFQCTDVDECSQSSHPCGPNTNCTNIFGGYTCSCLPGFSSAHGNSWIPGRTGPFQCTDVDECSQSPHPCGPNTSCTNSFGGYTCSCLPGFSSPHGNSWIPGRTGPFPCTDVDECMDATACPTHAICTNTPGNYFCTCKHGYKPSTSEVNFRGQGIQCRKIPVRCKVDLVDEGQVRHCQSNSTVLPEHIFFCMLMDSIFSATEDICENKTSTVSLEKAAEDLASVLEETSTWHNLSQEGTSTLATAFLESVESATLAAFASLSGNTSQTVENEYLEIKSKVIQDECLTENLVLTLSAKGDSMQIECNTINESVSLGTLSGITGVAFTSFLGMESILDEKFFYIPDANLIRSHQKLRMNSRVVGGIITGEKKGNFSNLIITTLQNLQPKKSSDRSICISWDPKIEGGRWTPTGCITQSSNETHTKCGCYHLANMAVIMASGDTTMDFALMLISHVGIIISLICLILAIATFVLCRSIQNRNTTLHLHLCVCLFLAKLLFLIGVVRTENKIMCMIIAGLLHYLFLACFAWMLVEAVMLFLTVRNLEVVNYFSSRNIKMCYLCSFGYGLPGLIVVLAAGNQWEGYGMKDRCWLNTDTGFIWSFLGPVCTIIMINSVLLMWTLWILRNKLSSVNAEVSTIKDKRLLTFKAFAQLFILGSSWILGIFQIGPIANVMAYLFTIINSLQGTFIFIIHCVLNRQVRKEYARCFSGVSKVSPTSQTSGILLSATSQSN
ncbi:adhesion G protein-coupled receptor E1 isoform X5 [Notamacropus eugenii]|uniref:adhesion G protein-coupled receptor E1 isoform X5 n=1 Tax=Notamacropus eugenii TaxID=9315 RepID=UPI003B67BBD6